MTIVALFCKTDEFFFKYEKWRASQSLPAATPARNTRTPTKSTSQRGDDHPHRLSSKWISDFKHFYQKHVCVYWRTEFPNLVSYPRFVQLKKEVLTVLTFYLYAHFGECSGISFVDSTRLRVCDNKRISSPRVFASEAGRSKTAMGWLYGFKRHLVINEKGDLLSVDLTPGNTDDRCPVLQ